MCDEAQRIIQEARARAMDRLAAASCPCPGDGGGGGGGAIRRHPTSPDRTQAGPPVQQLVPLSPNRPPDPQRMAHLQDVFERSLNPVPRPRNEPEEEFQPPWDYPLQDDRGPYDQNPQLWEQVQGYDPYGQQGAGCPERQGNTSYYDMLTECREPEVDYTTGAPEEVLGRARHRGLLAAGFRKDIPLYAPPLQPGADMSIFQEKKKDPPVCENVGPSLDEILAGAPQLPPSPSECNMYQQMQAEEDDDLDLLPPAAIENLRDDFAVQTVQNIQPTVDAFGLPYRRYPLAEQAQQEKMKRQQDEMLRRQQDAARTQYEAHQRATQVAAEEEAERRGAGARARPTQLRPPVTRGAAPPGPLPTSRGACPPPTQQRPPGGYPQTTQLRPPVTRGAAPPGPLPTRGGTCPPPTQQRPPVTRGGYPPPTQQRPPMTRGAAPPGTPGPSTSRGGCPPPTQQRPPVTRSAAPPGTAGPSTSRGACPRPQSSRSSAPATTANRPEWQGVNEENKAEKAAKAAALLELHKKRTQYKPPSLRTRPPSKPPTKPKAPRGLDKRDRDQPDPTRSMMYNPDYGYDYGYVEQQPSWDAPQPRTYPDMPDPMSCPQPQPRQYQQPGPGAGHMGTGPGNVPPELLNEVTGIICQTRNRLLNTINKFQ